jgi:hypothetical protein
MILRYQGVPAEGLTALALATMRACSSRRLAPKVRKGNNSTGRIISLSLLKPPLNPRAGKGNNITGNIISLLREEGKGY